MFNLRAFFIQKQCQVAVLPLGTGNDLARVLGWGSSCDDDAHLPQLLERYESASTKMLDRWSVMVFEKTVAYKPRMSMCHGFVTMLNEFVALADYQLQAIIDTDELEVVVQATETVGGLIRDYLAKIGENFGEDEQMQIRCEILR